MTDRFAYGLTEERFEGDFATREEAYEEGRAGWGDDCAIFTGRIVEIDIAGHVRIDAEQVVVDLNDHIADRIGDAVEGYGLQPTPEQVDDLRACLVGALVLWARRHSLEVGAFAIEDVEHHEAEWEKEVI